MKANDLRVWNYFQHNGIVSRCLGVTIDEHEHGGIVWYDKELGFYLPLNECFGIPITEEWLLKFGFEKDEDYFSKESYHLRIFEASPNRKAYFYSGNDHVSGGNLDAVIMFVHQLQNIYFALTGEELELNEPLADKKGNEQ